MPEGKMISGTEKDTIILVLFIIVIVLLITLAFTVMSEKKYKEKYETLLNEQKA